MKNTEDNFKRALAEVVSIDGWHNADPEQPAQADIHMHVSFRTATMGRGDKKAKVTFDLAILQAEVIVHISENSALDVVGGTVDQTDPSEMSSTSTMTRTSGQSMTGEASAERGKGFWSKVAGKIWNTREKKQVVEGKQTQRNIDASYFKLDGHHGWILTPQHGSELRGAVWKAKEERRLRVIDDRSDEARERDNRNGFDPEVNLLVRCLPEHLEISNVRATDERIKNQIPDKVVDQIQMTAAEQYLKERLLEENLVIADPGRDLDRYIIGHEVISVG